MEAPCKNLSLLSPQSLYQLSVTRLQMQVTSYGYAAPLGGESQAEQQTAHHTPSENT